MFNTEKWEKIVIVAAVALLGWFAYGWYTDGAYDSNAKFIGNRDKAKFHKVSCRYAKKMVESNKFYSVTREKLVKKGMRPAQCCKP